MMKSQDGNNFSLLMAWREVRGSWRQFIFFVICLSIGIGSLVAIELFSANVERLILHDARMLLGGDLEMQLSRQLNQSEKEILASMREQNIRITNISELVSMATVSYGEHKGITKKSTQLVELKVIEDNYPLYGTVKLEPDQPLSILLASGHGPCPGRRCFGVVVEESLLISLGIQLGEYIKMGEAWFAVSGMLVKEPDRIANVFNLGPRVIISREALAATHLIKEGSRIRERYLFQLPESLALAPVMWELERYFENIGAKIFSYRDAQPRIRRFLDQLSIYLGLISLTTILIGGIGVACTIHGFMKQKLMTIAILKTLGADNLLIIRVYLLQSLFIGCIGCLVGVILGVGLQMLLPELLSGLLSVTMSSQVTSMPVLKGIFFGLFTTLIFTVWPLLTIRDIHPALVFRHEVNQILDSKGQTAYIKKIFSAWHMIARDHYRLGAALSIGCGLTAMAMWQARSIFLGLLFIAVFGAALVVFQFGVGLFLRGLSKAPRPNSFAIRQAFGNIQRPGNYTQAMSMAMGLGVMVIMTVALVKSSLISTIRENLPEDVPTFFFLDIQPDQKEIFQRVVQREAQEPVYRLTPVVRSRLGKVNGESLNQNMHKATRNGWYFTREYVLTSLLELPEGNTIVKGKWWTDRPGDMSEINYSKHSAEPIKVSVENEAAKNLGLDLGSVIEFDIQGTRMSAIVESKRKVNWGSFSMNFFMILSPGALRSFPMTYIATATVNPREENVLQQALVRALPNVTSIKIGDVLANMARLLEKLALAIQGVAFLVIVGGVAVMVTALFSTRYRRLHESAILKTIGATRKNIAISFAVEFAMLGILAGLIGMVLASSLSWVILYIFLDLPWTFHPNIFGWGLLITVGQAMLAGFLGSFRILGHSPLEILREE